VVWRLAAGLCTGAAAGEVDLVLRNPGGLRSKSWPLTTGVPFPTGALQAADRVALFDGAGRPAPLQTRVTSTWGPNASVRWRLLDFQAALDGAPRVTYRLRWGRDVEPAAPAASLSVRDLDGAAWEVTTGPLTFVIRHDRFDGLHRAALGGQPVIEPSPESGPYVVDGEGAVFRANAGPPDSVTIEERGPLRSVFCAKGWYYGEGGAKYCRYAVRIHAYAGQPFVKVLYTFIVTEPTGKARFRDVGFHLATPGARRAAFGGDQVETHELAAGESTYLLQYDSDKYLVNRGREKAGWRAEPTGRRARGWARARGTAPDSVATTLACRDFWQQFPKEFEVVGERGVRFHAWPAHGVAKPDRKVEDAMLQYLWFCHEGEVLDFTVPESYHSHTEGHNEREYRYVRSSKDANAIGLAKTHELLVWFHDAAAGAAVAKAAEIWQADPVIMADPKWMCASGVFGRLHPHDPERFPKIESGLSRGWDAERRLEAHTRDYGMFNWGDGHTSWDMGRQRWSDVYRCWRAFHHGAPRTSWVLYLRSGDPKYWRHALRNARHCMDVDLCHWSRPEYEKLPWPRGKIRGALRDYKGLTHWHAGSRLFDYNSLTDFMLYYYYLTGDHRGWDVAREWGAAIKQRFSKPRGHREGAGVTAALIELYKATWDPEYRRIIDLYVNNFFDREQNLDGSRLTPPDVARSVPQFKDKPLPRGAFPQWENYAPWIERYYDLTGDERTGERIVAWADAYLAGWGDNWSKFSPNAYVNTMAYAYFVSKDPKYLARGMYCTEKYVSSVEDSPGKLYDGFPHLGQMSLGPGYMEQRIPYFLAALAEHGRPVEPQGPPPGPFGLLFTRRRPNNRKTEYVDALIREERDAAFRITAEGATNYESRPIRCEVRAPDGEIVLEQEFVFKPGAFRIGLDVPADGRTGDHALRIYGEGSFWSVLSTLRTTPELKIAYPFAGRLVRFAKSRYYFHVPTGATGFRVEVTPVDSGAMFSLRNPDDARVVRTSVPVGAGAEDRTVRVAVPPAHAGRLWLLEGWSSTATVAIHGEGAAIPQYFTADPALYFAP